MLSDPVVTRELHADWLALTEPGTAAAAFDPDTVFALPEPARRWLLHSIAPGTPLLRRAVLKQTRPDPEPGLRPLHRRRG